MNEESTRKPRNDDNWGNHHVLLYLISLASIAFLVTHFVRDMRAFFSGRDVNFYDYFSAFCIGSSIMCGRLLRLRRNRFKDQRKATETYEI